MYKLKRQLEPSHLAFFSQPMTRTIFLLMLFYHQITGFRINYHAFMDSVSVDDPVGIEFKKRVKYFREKAFTMIMGWDNFDVRNT